MSHSLSTNTAERERLLAAHPGESQLMANNRVLGLPASRAFGSLRQKRPAEAISWVRDELYCPSKRPHYPSQPYLHAEPGIKTVTVRPGDFLVLASDALWDSASQGNTVACLGLWIDNMNRRAAEGLISLNDKPGPECGVLVPI